MSDFHDDDGTPLRPVSERPELIVDELGRQVIDAPPWPGTQPGIPPAINPLIPSAPGRAFANIRTRLVYALPLKDGPKQVTPHVVVCDAGLGYLVDIEGNLVGFVGSWAARVIYAGTTQSERGVA